MFERFNDAARRALFFARYEASQLGSVCIESEHVLLGVIREGHSRNPASEIGHRILALSGLSPEQILKRIEARVVIRPKVANSIEIPFSDQMKRVLQLAADEADRLQHAEIGPEHLLLGLLQEGQSTAAAALGVGRMSLSEARNEALKM